MARWFSSWGQGTAHSRSSSPPSARVVRGGGATTTAASSSCAVTAADDHHHHTVSSYADNNSMSSPTRRRRRRLNSREYPRSYSGQYGQGDDLLPLELQRHHHHGGGGGGGGDGRTMMIGLYLTVVLIIQLLVALVLLVPSGVVVTSTTTTTTWWLSPRLSWTVSNALHAALTTACLHWIKGALRDDAGELNALTVWEQWEAQGADSRTVREACMVVPCLLAWAACHAADYAPATSACNAVLWAVSLLPKMSFMNGVRLFGINRTAGIDDDDDDDDDDGGKIKRKTP